MGMLKLTSKPSCICEVEKYVRNLTSKYQISQDLYPNILISLTEAVNNAIRHGNRSDEEKLVQIGYKKKKDCLRFTISDEGKGFDYQKLPDPTAPDNVIKCGGRGVFLMRELSDDVCYQDNGSTVELTFRL
jgi:serine/threonine-protein kinase RsbW